MKKSSRISQTQRKYFHALFWSVAIFISLFSGCIESNTIVPPDPPPPSQPLPLPQPNPWNLPADINNVHYLDELSQAKIADFSFFYAGHAYGKHNSKTYWEKYDVEYPAQALLDNIPILKEHDLAIFGGDVIERCLPPVLKALKESLLKPLAMPIFNSTGNHDVCLANSENYDYEQNIAFQYGHTLFLITSSAKLTLEGAKVSWLIKKINESKSDDSVKNVFVLTHRPIFLSFVPELQQAAQLANDPVIEEQSIIDRFSESLTDFAILDKELYWLAGDVGVNYPLIYHQFASNIYFIASGMYENNYDHVVSVRVQDTTLTDKSIVSLDVKGLSSYKFKTIETYTYQWLKEFLK